MTEKILNEQVALSNVRIIYPKVFKAEQYVSNGKPSGKPRFSCTFMIEPGGDNFKAVENAIKAAANAKWPGKGEAKLKGFRGNSNKFCFIDGDTKDNEIFEGLWILTAHRKEDQGRPGVFARNKSPLAESDNEVYGGIWADARVEIWAQDGENSGIRCKLSSIRKLRDGEPLSGGGRRPSADDYDDVEEEESVV